MLASELRLMCVLAYPDDESLGTGGQAFYRACSAVNDGRPQQSALFEGLR